MHLKVGPKEEGQRSEVIRFKNPNKEVTFPDMIRGDISFNTKELGDFVIAKDMDTPLYHLAVVVDDLEMGITHIIRGEDGISNTPRQILIQEALGASQPKYAHIPLILAPDRSKLSKRHGAIALTEFRDQGYLPEAIINFLALMGWHPEGEQEIFSVTELISEFDLEAVQKGGAMFNIEKLNWINKEYIKKLPAEEVQERITEHIPADIKALGGYSGEMLGNIMPLILERIHVFADVAHMAEGGEVQYFFEKPIYDAEKLIWKKETAESTKEHIDNVINL